MIKSVERAIPHLRDLIRNVNPLQYQTDFTLDALFLFFFIGYNWPHSPSLFKAHVRLGEPVGTLLAHGVAVCGLPSMIGSLHDLPHISYNGHTWHVLVHWVGTSRHIYTHLAGTSLAHLTRWHLACTHTN